MRLFRQNSNVLALAGSLALHGVCAAVFLARAQTSFSLPEGDFGAGEAISVSLVSRESLQAEAAAPAGAARAAEAPAKPIMRSQALAATPPSEGTGQGGTAVGEGSTGEGLKAAPAASAAAGSDYRARLLAHIQAFRRYPAQAVDARGVTQLLFMVDKDGRIVGVWVKASSGFAALDNEAVATVLRAQPMPQAPPGMPAPLTVQLPVSFNPS